MKRVALFIVGLLAFSVHALPKAIPDDTIPSQASELKSEKVVDEVEKADLDIKAYTLSQSQPTGIANKSLVSASGKKAADMSAISNWPTVIFTMFGMIFLIFLLAWFVKRFTGMNFAGNKDMKLVSSIALGTKERVCLVDVNGQNFLLGVTSQNINHLHTFDQLSMSNSNDESDSVENSKRGNVKSDFAQKLGMFLKPNKQSESLSGSEE